MRKTHALGAAMLAAALLAGCGGGNGTPPETAAEDARPVGRKPFSPMERSVIRMAGPCDRLTQRWIKS